MQSSVQKKSFDTQNVVQIDGQENWRVDTSMEFHVYPGGLQLPTPQNMHDNLGLLHQLILRLFEEFMTST